MPGRDTCLAIRVEIVIVLKYWCSIEVRLTGRHGIRNEHGDMG
jgi:hypothetical protein